MRGGAQSALQLDGRACWRGCLAMMEVCLNRTIIPLLVAALVALSTWSGHRRARASGRRLSQGYYRGRGMAWGLAAGLALDAILTALTNNLVLGVAIGVTLGLTGGALLGGLWERKHSAELRPLSSDERDERRFVIVLALVAIVLGVLAVLGITVFSR